MFFGGRLRNCGTKFIIFLFIVRRENVTKSFSLCNIRPQCYNFSFSQFSLKLPISILVFIIVNENLPIIVDDVFRYRLRQRKQHWSVYICACTYVCMYVSLHVCMHAYICIHGSMLSGMYAYIHACQRACIYACMKIWMHAHLCICIHTCMRAHRRLGH
jgi:hypothetical protein